MKGEGTDKLKRGVLLCGGVLLTALLFLGIRFYTRVALEPMRAFTTPSPQASAKPTASAVPSPQATAVPTPSPQELLISEADESFMHDRVNILLLGWDQSPERENEDSSLYRDEENNFRSDVMMLASVDFANKRIQLISIPRDTMASIYETTGRWKINAAFAKGGSVEGDGFEYAVRTVENLLAVPINCYAGVDMQGVKAVVDAMGGVDYDVDVRIELNGRVLEEGMQHLDGQQVLDYCRARKRITGTNSAGANSDVGRADRQQRMIFSLFRQLQQRDQLVNIPRIYESVKPYVYTNMNAEQIAALALFGQGLDADTQLFRYTLPGEMVTKTSFSNASFYVLDTIALQDMMRELYGVSIPVDHRFGLAYVRAEKDAKLGRKYAECARYIAALFGVDLERYAQSGTAFAYETEFASLYEMVKKTEEKCKRKAWSEVGGYDDDLPALSAAEDEAILASVEEIRAALFSICTARGLQASQLDEDRVPEEFLELLEKAYLYGKN